MSKIREKQGRQILKARVRITGLLAIFGKHGLTIHVAQVGKQLIVGKTKVLHSDVGCSRTLPVASSWNGQDGVGANNSGASLVKREPLASVPCQVAEVSTSLHATTTSVKIEPVPPKSENGKSIPGYRVERHDDYSRTAIRMYTEREMLLCRSGSVGSWSSGS